MIVIRLAFDPCMCEDPATSTIFQNDTARTLYLLWRQSHIVGPDFACCILQIAKQVAKLSEQPTVQDIVRCFARFIIAGSDFTLTDIKKFAEAYLPYLLHKRKIGYEVNTLKLHKGSNK